MDLEKRFDLIESTGEEVITREELRSLLQTKQHPVAYDGFEPSGQMHIAQGVMRAIDTNKLTEAGVHFKFLVADWHAWANNKMGGNLDVIKKVGDYFVEIWKAAGMDMKNVSFVYASDYMNSPDYWKNVLAIAKASTVARIVRCGQIMGRSEKDVQQASQIIYPCMQASDIFHLEADITHLGMDQRKVNILARELGPQLGLWKPVVVSFHMLMGLGKPAEGIKDPVERAVHMKMSKSVPDSAIFMTDSEEDVKRKISKAFCPEKQMHDNPIIDYMHHIIFESFKTVKIDRPSKFGGPLEVSSFDELKQMYSDGHVHPADLKNACAFYVNELLAPVRRHFAKGKAKELSDFVKKQAVTR